LYFLNSSRLGRYLNGTTSLTNVVFNNFSPYDLFFPDSINGYVLGDSSSSTIDRILKTTDGGNSFQEIFSDSTFAIRKMFFVDSLQGFLIGDSGKIAKTNDGGNQWNYLSTGYSNDLTTITFLNSVFGFVGGHGGLIIRTTDGGQSWTRDSINALSAIDNIVFVNDSFAYARTYNVIYQLNLASLIGIEEINSPFPFVLFPNPNHGHFKIKTKENDLIHSICLFDIYGNQVSELLIKGLGEVQMDLSLLSKGLYYIKLNSNQRISYSKVIIN
jgi:hypothetical protein